MFNHFNFRKGIRLGKFYLAAFSTCLCLLSANLSAASPIRIFNHQTVTSFGNASSTNQYQLVIPQGGTKSLKLSMEYLSGRGQLSFYPKNPAEKPLYCLSDRTAHLTQFSATRLQTCEIPNLEQGTYIIQVAGKSDSFYGSLVASYSDTLSVEELVPGIWYEPSGESGNLYDFTVTFPDNAREFELEFKPDDNVTNAELLFTPTPTTGSATSTFVTCPLPGNTYVCNYRELAAGTYKVRLKANTDFTSSKLLVRYALPLDANRKLRIKSGKQNGRYDFYYLPTGDEINSQVRLVGDVDNISMTVHNGVDKNDFSTVCETEDISSTKKLCTIDGNMTTYGYYYVALHAGSDFTEARLMLRIP